MAWKHPLLGFASICLLSAAFLSGIVYADIDSDPSIPVSSPSATSSETTSCPSSNPQPEPETFEISINVTEQREDIGFLVHATNPHAEHALRIHRGNFRLLDKNNTVYQPYDTYGVGEEGLFPRTVTLQPGQSAKGYIIYSGLYNDTHAIDYVSDHGGIHGYTLLDKPGS